MEPFALAFMVVSMTAVTLLAGFCLRRILRGGGGGGDAGGEDG